MAINDQEKDLLKAAAEIIKRETEAGERVNIRDFGTFERKTRKATTGRNLITGATVQVPAKTVLHYKAAKSTKAVVV
ncbi:MAG: HU family DNA-binding protein [Bacteroidota bacterium]|jgi:nucleoid DNA-binding protein